MSLDEPPAHLVLLDSPDNLKAQIGGANNNLAPVLRRLDLGANGTFVDNYVSSFGVPYGDMKGLEPIIDISLDPGRDLFGATGHAYPLLWYQRSAVRVAKAVGFAWSPLRLGERGFDPPKRGEDLEQDWLRKGEPVPARELALHATGQRHGPPQTFQRAGIDAHDGDAAPDDHDVVKLSEGGNDGTRPRTSRSTTTTWPSSSPIDSPHPATATSSASGSTASSAWSPSATWAGTRPQTVALDIANLPAGTHGLSLAARAFGDTNATSRSRGSGRSPRPGSTSDRAGS